MSNTKRCPACNGEVPMLAVRCKFCGVRLDPPIETLSDGPELTPPGEHSVIADLSDFDLDGDLDINLNDDGSEHQLGTSPSASAIPSPKVSAPPPAPKSSVPPPTPSSKVSAPPPPPISGAPAPMAPKSSTPPPAPTSAAPPAARVHKGTMLGMPPIKLPSDAVVSGTAPADSFLSEKIDDLGQAGVDSLVTPSAAYQGEALDGLDLDDDLLDDDLDEISKFTEQTAITDVSTLAQDLSDDDGDDLPPDLLEDIMEQPTLEHPPEISADATLPDFSPMNVPSPSLPEPTGSVPQPTPAAAPAPVTPAMMAEAAAVSAAPAPQKQGMNPIMYGVFAMVALLAVGGIAFLVLSGGDEPVDTPVADESSSPDKAPEAEKEAENKPGKNEDQAVVEKEATPTEAPEAKAVEHKCKSMKAYPDFPWKEKLDSVVGQAGKESLCGLFGLQKEQVAAWLKSDPAIGPTGYDLLPNASVVEVFPLGKAKRPGPTMEYVFVDDTLFEIRLKYQMDSADKLKKDPFKGLLGNPKRTRKDPAGRQVNRYTDDDMLVEWFKRTDAYKRSFNEIVFSSNLKRDAMSDAIDNREKAIIAFAQGMALFNKEPSKAIEKYKKARGLIPQMGIAYVFEGISALQFEDFTTAGKVAKSALENSLDDRAKAGAKGLQAVVALYNAEKQIASDLFKEASDLDPADSEFSTSLKELESGSYDPSRVAKTAARMSCKKTHPKWSTKGLLARGNFPDNSTFAAAKRKVKRSKAYKSAYDMWVGWECN